MKSIILILIYLTTFISLFFLLSLLGLIWTPYIEVISNIDWDMIYSLLIGSWISVFPAREYYINNKGYFDKIF